MPKSRVALFADPDTYRAAIRGAGVEFSIIEAGEFRAELTQVDLPRAWMLRGRESLSKVCHAEVTTGRSAIFFLADAKQASMQHGGMELSPGEIVVWRAHATHHNRSSGPIRWASMSLTPEDLADAGRTLAGCNLTVPVDTYRLRPSSAYMSRLLKLHTIAGQLARTMPDVLAQTEVSRALDHALVHAMIGCLTAHSSVRKDCGEPYHSVVMARFEELLAAKHNETLYLADICAATGASERTLRICCQEHLGMGPIRYLWLRRMHLARRALVQADLSRATVTDIATEYGFWELGRFAVDYKTLFGESPSQSLRRPPDDRRRPKNRPFDVTAQEFA
jgi:AraC-like DNA-binding protein